MRKIITRPPTYDEIENNTYVKEFDAYAMWYPQMGGYAGKCWIQFDDNGAEEGAFSNTAMLFGGCFETYVYHDGDFPTEYKPIITHHCSWEQFIKFGEQVGKFEKQRKENK